VSKLPVQATTSFMPNLKDEKPSSSTLFDQIYEIAKNAKNDTDTIKKLSLILTPDTCIDVRDNTGLQTPAGKLAKEGNKEAVELLMKLGANVNDIAAGAAIGGHRDYAEHLRQNHGANVNNIARGAAIGGHRDYAEHLRINHGANVNDIAKGTADSFGFVNKTIALHSLSFMTNKNYRAQIAKELKDQKLVSFDVTKLVPKAERIAELRPKYNYSQCIAFGNREIQTWYLQCAVLVGNGKNKLAPELFLSVATYLSPLTHNEAGDFYKKSRFDMFQKLLVQGVDQYCKKTQTLYFFDRDKQAEEFSVNCAKAKERNELQSLLDNENKRINGDEKSQQNKKPNPYNEIIVRNLKRLK
jgi:hypothetical protein